MHRFFVARENMEGKRGRIVEPELQHMRKALRLRPGQSVILFDDGGWEHEAVIQSYTPLGGELEILRSYRPERESPLSVVLAQAIGKGEKMDWVVEKATELGVQVILPFFSARTVPRISSEKISRRRTRWGKIALSAAKQSGRTRIPEIEAATDFSSLVGRPWPCDLKFILCEGTSGESLNRVKEERKYLDSILLVIGPEGGFSAEEVARAVGHGFRAVRLGNRIMRTETAALGALAIVQSLWGDMG